MYLNNSFLKNNRFHFFHATLTQCLFKFSPANTRGPFQLSNLEKLRERISVTCRANQRDVFENSRREFGQRLYQFHQYWAAFYHLLH